MPLVGTNLGHARQLNRQVILEIVRVCGSISRADLARRTGLALQTVSNITRELIAAEILVAGKRRKSGLGQPPVIISINPQGAYTVGLHLDTRSYSVMLVNLQGEIVAEATHPLEGPAPELAFTPMVQAIEQLLKSARIERKRVWGIGVAQPGPFSEDVFPESGLMSMPEWVGFPLAPRLSEAVKLPVQVENDATAAAIGEKFYGIGRTLSSFFYIHFDAGVGGGMILNGQPYTGVWRNAGEIGHVSVDPGGLSCPCGNRGCLERYLSLHSLADALDKPGMLFNQADWRVLKRDEPDAFGRWILEAGKHLRAGVMIIENLFDPETIVLGGRLPGWMLTRMIAAADPLGATVSSTRSRVLERLTIADVNELPALGAAALPIFYALTPTLPAAVGSDESSATGGNNHRDL